MTRIYIGNRYQGKFTCDGRVMTRFQAFIHRAGVLVKRSIIVSGAFSAIAWSLYAGSQYFPRTAWAEKVVEVPIAIKFDDIPMLVKICKAESGGGHQFKANGNVVRGIVDPSDIGYCQINEAINNDDARKLGYDIYTEEGNKGYAIHLYFTRGTQPWSASKCIEGGWGTKSECNK